MSEPTRPLRAAVLALAWSMAAGWAAPAASTEPAPAPPPQAPATDQPAAPQAPGEPQDEKEFREVIDILKRNYASPEMLREAEIGRAALEGVLGRLGANAMLMSSGTPEGKEYYPLKTEVLPHMIGYIRLPSFRAKGKENWDAVRRHLTEWEKGNVIGLVLDVRDFQASGDFEGAAEMASLLLPDGTTLFTIQGMQVPQEVFATHGGKQPLFTKPVAILTNPGTRGAAEALAAALRLDAGALIVGRSTAGQAARYVETKLTTGRVLRMAAGEVALADGTPLFGRPVTPDVPVVVDSSVEKRALASIQEKGARTVAREYPRRQRMSEAALVREENPELDAALAAQEDEEIEAEKDFLQDVALLRAMDALRVIDLNRRHLEAAAKRDTF